MLTHFSPLQPLQNYLSPQPMNLSASLFIPFPNPVLTHHNCALPSSLRAPGWIIDGAWLSPSCPCCKAWHRAVGFLLSHTWTEEPQLALGMKVPNCLVSETVGGLLADCAYPHIIKYWGCHPWLLPARAWKVPSDSWFTALIRNSWCILDGYQSKSVLIGKNSVDSLMITRQREPGIFISTSVLQARIRC